MLKINHQRLSADEAAAVERAADDVYDLLIERACEVGAPIFHRRLIDPGSSEEAESIACSDMQMRVAGMMIAHMMKRSTEI